MLNAEAKDVNSSDDWRLEWPVIKESWHQMEYVFAAIESEWMCLSSGMRQRRVGSYGCFCFVQINYQITLDLSRVVKTNNGMLPIKTFAITQICDELAPSII